LLERIDSMDYVHVEAKDLASSRKEEQASQRESIFVVKRTFNQFHQFYETLKQAGHI